MDDIWERILNQVDVFRYNKGDMITVGDFDEVGYFGINAKEDGIIVQALNHYLVVSNKMIENARHISELAEQKRGTENEYICDDFFVSSNNDDIYECRCGFSYKKKDYNKWVENDCEPYKIVGEDHRPVDYPDYWIGGRCKKCKQLITKQKGICDE